MIVSFFEDWKHVTGADYSHREDCVHVEEIDLNIETQEPVLVEKKWKFSVKIVEKVSETSNISENPS